MIYHMEFAVLISLIYFFQQLMQLEHNPLVQFFHIFQRYRISLIVEVIDIAQKVTEGVPDFAIRFAYLFQNALRNSYVIAIIGRGHPQTQDICAHIVYDFQRVYAVAQGFTHFAALLVHQEAMGQNCLVRRHAVQSHRGEQ